MKKFALATVALAALTLGAQAADLGYKKPSAVVPVMAKYNWTGFYVGITGGYGFGADNKHSNGVLNSGNINNDGAYVGATLGYNYHMSNDIVLGAEADYGWSDFNGNTLVNCAAPGCRTNVRSFGTVRARAGYAIDRFMPYITGGLALGDVRAAAGPVIAGSSFRAGWTIGAGVEAAIWQNVTAKVEYLYYDLGKYTYNTGANLSTTTKGHLVRVGLNYRF